MIFENQALQSISFQGEEGPLSAWVGAQEIANLLIQAPPHSLSRGRSISCPLSDGGRHEMDGENTKSQSLSTGLVLSAYQFLKFNILNNSNSTQEN